MMTIQLAEIWLSHGIVKFRDVYLQSVRREFK